MLSTNSLQAHLNQLEWVCALDVIIRGDYVGSEVYVDALRVKFLKISIDNRGIVLCSYMHMWRLRG